MIRKLKSGEYRLYSRKKDSKTGKRKNLGTFKSLAAAKKHGWVRQEGKAYIVQDGDVLHVLFNV